VGQDTDVNRQHLEDALAVLSHSGIASNPADHTAVTLGDAEQRRLTAIGYLQAALELERLEQQARLRVRESEAADVAARRRLTW
jgi:hypothetical protein